MLNIFKRIKPCPPGRVEGCIGTLERRTAVPVAMTMVIVAGLVEDEALVEIEATAAIPR